MNSRIRRSASPIAAAAAAATLCGIPLSAAAASYYAGQVMVSPGVAFSISFGREIEFGVVFDLRLMVLVRGEVSPSCSTTARSGLGPYGQAAWYSRTGWRFGAGVQGGAEIGESGFGTTGELGWSYRRAVVMPLEERLVVRLSEDENPGFRRPAFASSKGSHGLHLGILGQAAPPEAVAFGVQIPLGLDIPLTERSRGVVFATGVGIRVPTLFGLPGGGCAFGRPLRQHGEPVLPPVVVSGPCAPREFDAAAAQILSQAWLDDARAECASVPVFVALARDLARVGAPIELVERALAAAAQEIRHTVLCSQLASHFAGAQLSPLLLDVPAASDADRQAALCRLAIEAWSDGCLGEGAAAAQAAHACRQTVDDAARHTLSIIARDEAGHAELAWSVLDFCLQAGGPRVRDAVAAHILARHCPPPHFTTAAAEPSLLRAQGRLVATELETLWHTTARRAHVRGARLLAT